MGKKLASTVYVQEEDGSVTRLDPGTKYTAKLGKAITNPSAWVEDEPEPVAADAETPPEPKGDQTPAGDQAPQGDQTPAGDQAPQGDQTPPGDNEGDQTAPTVEPPPRAGQGSGRDAWADYAKNVHNVEVPETSGRDDIIAFLEERELIGRETA